MSCERDNLPDEHREAFSKRLAVYGLTADSLHGGELRVTRDSMLTLSMSGNTHVQPRILRTTDLDVVKRWVGVDDRVAQRYARPVCLPPLNERESTGRGYAGGDRAKERLARQKAVLEADTKAQTSEQEAKLASRATRGVSRQHLEAVQQAARAYVRGYSKLVQPEYKQAVELVFGEFLIPVWAFNRIVVENGSVLQLGPGSNVLTAWEVEIQGSGTIRSKGHLKVDCTNLRHSNVISSLAATTVSANLIP